MTPSELCPRRLADLAVGALLSELELFPKPGLVSPVDSGSHKDMDYALLRASALCLHDSFVELAQLGAEGSGFEEALVPAGLRAEQRMTGVTGGVNTHRGAIFSMGLLVAASGATHASGIREVICSRWGSCLRAHADAGVDGDTHGSAVRRVSGIGGAREEAAMGFPSIFELALPCLARLLGGGVPFDSAGVETLFVLMASIPDTNVIHRGGMEGARFVAQRAHDFLGAGGIQNPSWRDVAVQIHHEFVDAHLSPGGCADLLAGTFFIQSVLRTSSQGK